MQWSRISATALKGLKRNPTRAGLTTLGIIIGVAAVIAMMEIGKGSSTAIQRTISSMGANNLLVHPGTAASSGVSFGAGTAMTLTPEDAEAIAKECPSVRSAAPIVRSRTQVAYRARNWVPLYIYGTTPDFLDVRDWHSLTAGDFFTTRDVRNRNRVCVVGQTLARELFGSDPAVGKEIRVQNVPFRVVGVLSPKGANMMGMDQDDILLAPWTTIKNKVSGSTSSAAGSQSSASNPLYAVIIQNLYPQQSSTQAADTPSPVRFTNIDQILVAARSTADIKPAIAEITTLLRERHRIPDGEPDDFNVRDMTEMTNALTSTAKLMTNLLLIVALISLVVGGIGIMNIMLVSVTERTREIGLRMAVGARAKDIMQQFLAEAVFLCLAGGAFGILLGRTCSLLVSFFLNWPVQLSLTAIAAAVLVSGSVGIAFGFYPAWKASRLDPIEALRYE